MPAKVLRGVPVPSNDIIRSVSMRTTNENPVPFASGDTRTERITRDHPIRRILFKLSGTLDVSVGAATSVNALGVLPLIQNLRVSRNGNRDVLSAPGKLLRKMHRLTHEHDGYTEDLPATPVATYNFVEVFELVLDVGGYLSLLDATGDQSLDVSVTWGTVADIITAGAATVALSNVQLDMVPQVIDGIADGALGGRGASYLRNHTLVSDKSVTQTSEDFRFDLSSGRGYHGLTLFSFSDGALSNAIIERVTLERANQTIGRWEADDIRALNHDTYDLSGSEFVGVLDIPHLVPDHLEHTLAIDPRESMRVILKVAHPGVTDQIFLAEQFFRST